MYMDFHLTLPSGVYTGPKFTYRCIYTYIGVYIYSTLELDLPIGTLSASLAVPELRKVLASNVELSAAFQALPKLCLEHTDWQHVTAKKQTRFVEDLIAICLKQP